MSAGGIYDKLIMIRFWMSRTGNYDSALTFRTVTTDGTGEVFFSAWHSRGLGFSIRCINISRYATDKDSTTSDKIVFSSEKPAITKSVRS